MLKTVKAPSGRDIWNAVRDEMLANLYPLPFSTLAPSIYHVYLHPDDFATVEQVAPRVVEQVQRALTGEVERVNRGLRRSAARLLTRLLDRDGLAPIEVPAGGWEVHILADRDGELDRGKFGIISTLSLPASAHYDGTPTARIVKSVVSCGARVSTTTEMREAAPARGTAVAALDGSERARLTYEDDSGPHEFIVRKDSVAVGRGGSAAWVDVQLITGSTKVSREHFRLRRDGSRRFFIQDVSLWGTLVDGVPLPPAVKSAEGVVQPGAERELPGHAQVALAGVLVIHFRAAPE